MSGSAYHWQYTLAEESRELLGALEQCHDGPAYLIVVNDSPKRGLVVPSATGYVRGFNYSRGAVQELLDWGLVVLRGFSGDLGFYDGRTAGDTDVAGEFSLTDRGKAAAKALREEAS